MSDTKGQFTVIAEFQVAPGELQAFLSFAHEDARHSLADEDGCHQFDVLVAEQDDDIVVLHEVYANRAAFDAHTRMPHYQPFKKGTAPLLAGEPRVRFFVGA